MPDATHEQRAAVPAPEEGATEKLELNHLSDPGKVERLRAGIPVIPALDGFRALAIMAVVLMHTLGAAEFGAQQGDLVAILWGGTLGQAIDVLFVLSGFVVFLPTVARGGDFGSIGRYAIRRAARLIPAYWLVLILLILLLALVPTDGQLRLPAWYSYPLHFSGLHTAGAFLHVPLPMGFGIDGPVWTLAVEMSFYLVLPFVASAYFKRPLLGLLVAALVTVLWKTGFNHLDSITSLLGLEIGPREQVRLINVAYLQLPAWAFSFALGMTAAWAYSRLSAHRSEPKVRRGVWLAQALGVALLLAFGYMAGLDTVETGTRFSHFGRNSPLISLGYSSGLALLMLGIALGPRWQAIPFANSPIRKLGDISYGVYLIHVPVLIYASVLLAPPRGTVPAALLWLAIVLPASLAYGYFSARLLEQPIRRWARRFGRQADGGSLTRPTDHPPRRGK